jgi:hypothetical protein
MTKNRQIRRLALRSNRLTDFCKYILSHFCHNDALMNESALIIIQHALLVSLVYYISLFIERVEHHLFLRLHITIDSERDAR